MRQLTILKTIACKLLFLAIEYGPNIYNGYRTFVANIGNLFYVEMLHFMYWDVLSLWY